MSILTKILIVLLAFSSFFLCASVVTYVASANNYKQKYDNLKADRDALNEKANDLKEKFKEQLAENQRREEKLNNEIASLSEEIDELRSEFRNVKRENATLRQEVNSWVAVTENFSETNSKQRQLFENTFAELNRVKAEQIKERKELKDITATLIEKMAIITDLEIGKKRLQEEKVKLQNELNQILKPIGKEAVTGEPVTLEKGIVRPAMPPAGDIGLKAVVTNVDLKNSMASISISAADGVKTGMKFHVIRGDQFICDILILDTDAEEAVGVLELVTTQKPKVGDSVSTNF